MVSTFLFCFCFLERGSKYIFRWYAKNGRVTGIYEGGVQMKGNTFAKGMWRVVRKRSIDQMITRSFDQGEKADGQNKTMWPKVTGHSNAIRAAVQRCWRWCDIQQAPELLWTKMGGRQSRNRSRWSDCQTDSLYSKAADESCAYQKGFLVQKKSSVIGGRRIFLTKMHATGGKGICRSSWRKHVRCPRRLWV